ncbi:hypothetical protein Bca52824_086993 [Brassica carinata]|uniref:Endoplasmic reticulum transmembrane protein n=1 Tax=Brassica carinata TaxID=52824 RepID=A0A8X7TMC9_BRACI|nr:hypothetical protein Bca52824_086993 [Brassica carinata]
MLLKKCIVSVVSFILQPAASIVAFAGFQLLVLDYWYYQSINHLLDYCLIYKAQRNVVLCAAGILLYWCIHHICKYNKDLEHLEELEKRYKAE